MKTTVMICFPLGGEGGQNWHVIHRIKLLVHGIELIIGGKNSTVMGSRNIMIKLPLSAEPD